MDELTAKTDYLGYIPMGECGINNEKNGCIKG